MPRLNSGTERPRAPLLEPFIIKVLLYIKEKVNTLTYVRFVLTLYDHDYYNL